MTRSCLRLGTLVTACTIAVNASIAQTADEQSAYRALIYTPVAGLPSLPPLSEPLGSTGSGVTLHGRVGHMTRRGGLSLTTYGAGVEVPKGRFRLGGTLGYVSATCGGDWVGDTDCNGDVMLAGSVRTLLASKPLDETTRPPKGSRSARASQASSRTALLVGFDGSVGYSPRQGQSAMAIAAGLPTALRFTNGDVQIMPFLTPALAYGRMGSMSFDDETPTAYGSLVMMIGGGLGLQFGKSGVGASASFERVLKSDGGTTQFGVGLTMAR